MFTYEERRLYFHHVSVVNRNDDEDDAEETKIRMKSHTLYQSSIVIYFSVAVNISVASKRSKAKKETFAHMRIRLMNFRFTFDSNRWHRCRSGTIYYYLWCYFCHNCWICCY